MLVILEEVSNRKLVDENLVASLLQAEDNELPLLYDLTVLATRIIEDYTGRIFHVQRYREDIFENIDGRVLLSMYPIVEIVSVTCCNSDVEYKLLDAETGVLYIEPVARPAIASNLGIYPSGAVEYALVPVSVEYRAGYSEIPGEIQNACIELVKSMYLKRGSSSDVESENIGGYSVRYDMRRSLLDKLIGRWRGTI